MSTEQMPELEQASSQRLLSGWLVVLAVIALAGCGGSMSAPKATTLSAQQAKAQDKAAQNWQVGQPVPNAPTGLYVIECGGGLSTNGSCVFAENVKREFAPSTTIMVGSNPVACSPESAGAWRCKSKISAVWVQFR